MGFLVICIPIVRAGHVFIVCFQSGTPLPISPNYFRKANGCGVHTCSATMEDRKWQNHAEWQNLFEQVLES